MMLDYTRGPAQGLAYAVHVALKVNDLTPLPVHLHTASKIGHSIAYRCMIVGVKTADLLHAGIVIAPL
jgi:hypothetical protein